MVLAVCERLRGCNDNALAGGHPHRVEVFHVAHGYAIVIHIPDYLIFKLAHPLHGLLDEAGMRAAQIKCAFNEGQEIGFIAHYPRTAASKCEIRADYEGDAD